MGNRPSCWDVGTVTPESSPKLWLVRAVCSDGLRQERYGIGFILALMTIEEALFSQIGS